LSLREALAEDLKKALKSGDNIGRDTLRMVMAEVKNREIKAGAGTVLDDDGISDAIASSIKKCKESVRLYRQGGREDLASKETAEIEFLEKYLPEQLSEEELREIVGKVVKETGATDMKQMGQVMKAVMAEVGKKADGRLVNGIVKEMLVK
jgi:uncharacterized protein YqeY